MEISYWQSRWQKDNVGWHMNEVYPPLHRYWHRLELTPGSTVLVPLCGKSLDIDWLTDQGFKVIGVDLSQKGLEAIRKRRAENFECQKKGNFLRYTCDSFELWCGDFLKLHPRWLPAIDAIYDKAALIALPPDRRKAYAGHILDHCNSNTQIFQNTFEYNQDEMNGPPFAVLESEIRSLYEAHFTIKQLEGHSRPEIMQRFQNRGLRSYLREKIYHLRSL